MSHPTDVTWSMAAGHYCLWITETPEYLSMHGMVRIAWDQITSIQSCIEFLNWNNMKSQKRGSGWLTRLSLETLKQVSTSPLTMRTVTLTTFPLLYMRWYKYKQIHCKYNPYPEPVVFQWQSSVPGTQTQCTLECHWRNASVLPVVFQWSSSGFPVVFQCVPIMQINTGSLLGHHWVLASASVVPVASQCTCGSSGLPACSNYAN